MLTSLIVAATVYVSPVYTTEGSDWQQRVVSCSKRLCVDVRESCEEVILTRNYLSRVYGKTKGLCEDKLLTTHCWCAWEAKDSE